MKNLLFILLSFLIFSCTNPESNHIESPIKRIKPLQADTFSIKGLWVMSEYVDSIITNKTISKYRQQWPTWFAILIDIEKDSITSYGSIFDIKKPYNPNSDTILVYHKTITGQWTLMLNRETEKLELRNTDTKRKKIDSTIYTFNKRPELNFLLDTLNDVHKTKTSFSNYFKKELVAGNYQIIGNENNVSFHPDGKITGFKDFDKYEIDVYFGTSHPYKNIDNIRFYRDLSKDSKEFDWEVFKWEFENDTLVLTQFNFKTFEYNGMKVRDEFWNLSEKEIRLVKQ